MSKAYDRVKCKFLLKIMEMMGFHSRWIRLILECIISVSFSILVNGGPRGHTIPSRGLRQGDPLSQYLFFLCSAGLNSLVQHAVNVGDIQGFSLCRRELRISHLFFVDDSLLYCRATMGDIQAIQSIL